MNTCENYKIERIKNSEILPFLKLEPIYNAHSIYVCKNKPDDVSLAAISKTTNKIEAVLITGKPELFIVYGYYLAAANYGSAEVIIKEIKEMKDFSINYPIWTEGLIKKYFKNASLSYDNLYIYPSDKPLEHNNGKVKAQMLTCDLFKSIEIPKELQGLFNCEDFLPESKVYSVIENNRLCAIGERFMDSGATNAISQLLTIKECRKRGYAVKIITELTRDILKEKRIPLYLLSEDNVASKKSCEKVGFTLYSRIGYAEIE